MSVNKVDQKQRAQVQMSVNEIDWEQRELALTDLILATKMHGRH